MKVIKLIFTLLLIFTGVTEAYNSGEPVVLEVGKGKSFQSIQSAIDASGKYKAVVILIDEGTYRETLYISRNNLALVGVSAAQTIIQGSILRSEWRAEHKTDWGAAIVNINGADIMLVNMTVINNYGRHHGTDEHQFAIRGFENSDRVITHNCKLVADGSDTLSLWNKDGRYYHSHCHFEGYVDMVCPRGTALIEHSTFFNNKKTATLWHDGELNSEYKLVVNQSKFDGVDGFWLGRHHYDAQFYLLNSQFSERMADKPIFRKRYPENPSRERPNLWGKRYFFEANQSAAELAWTKDNFRIGDIIPGQHPSLEHWVFDNRWSPKQKLKELAELLTRRELAKGMQPIRIE